MPSTVKLEANLDLRATGRLAAEVDASRSAVMLDAAAVTHVGGLAAQYILAAHRAGGPRGMGLTVTNPSAGFSEGLRRLGLDPAAFT